VTTSEAPAARPGAPRAPHTRRGPRALGVLGADALLLTSALIWGITFIAQKLATSHLGPFQFTGLRYSCGALLLLPLAIYGWRRHSSARARRAGLAGGALAGVAMAVAAVTQQIGLHTTTASNAGFITGLYVLFVPLIGVVLGQRVRWPLWTGVALAIVGMFFLGYTGQPGKAFALQRGDLWVLACALAWGVHVQAIGWAARDGDALVVSTVQCAVTGIVGLTGAAAVATLMPGTEWAALESFRMAAVMESLGPLAFATVLSTGLAFTLQVVAQSSVPPVHAVIILSLEGVFSALAEAACLALGWWPQLGASMTGWRMLGCALMLAAAIVAQVRTGERR
jgi:drug/metabolite transporter (DMT)-like permease